MENHSSVTPLNDVPLTERELKHLAAAWLASSGKDTIDFDVFTILTGHPNSTNARKRFGEIKKKVRDQVFVDGGREHDPVPSTPKKRKPASATNGTDGSPTKKARGRAKKASADAAADAAANVAEGAVGSANDEEGKGEVKMEPVVVKKEANEVSTTMDGI